MENVRTLYFQPNYGWYYTGPVLSSAWPGSTFGREPGREAFKRPGTGPGTGKDREVI